jgi:hypothetical protein
MLNGRHGHYLSLLFMPLYVMSLYVAAFYHFYFFLPEHSKSITDCVHRAQELRQHDPLTHARQAFTPRRDQKIASIDCSGFWAQTGMRPNNNQHLALAFTPHSEATQG